VAEAASHFILGSESGSATHPTKPDEENEECRAQRIPAAICGAVSRPASKAWRCACCAPSQKCRNRRQSRRVTAYVTQVPKDEPDTQMGMFGKNL